MRFFTNSIRMDQKIQSIRQELEERQSFQVRIGQILTSIVPRSVITPHAISSFYTPKESDHRLIIFFDHGIDPEPSFSGPICCTLFLDTQHNLVLLYQPLDPQVSHLYRREILLHHVDQMHFQFLAKSSIDEPGKQTIPINLSYAWRSNWPQNRWDIPSLVRIELIKGGKTLSFAFPIPLSDPIIYSEKA